MMDKQDRPSKKRNDQRKLFGLPLIIEYRAGDLRGGTGADGKPWVRKLHCAYGEVQKTEGMDGDPLDVYIGPALDSEKVFAITQMKAPAFKVVDEQKFMLGFHTMAKARATYLAHYPDERILGSIVEMPLAKFQEKAMDPKQEGKKLSSLRRFIEVNLHREAAGEEKLSAARVMGGPGAAAVAAQFSAERGVDSPFTPDLGANAFNYRDYPRQPVSSGPAILHMPGRTIKVGADGAGRPLTVADRAEIKKNFAIPESRKYPIHDASHARSALSMVAKHGTPEEKERVRAAVAKKWPGIGPAKTASLSDRGSRIADRIDDAGLAILAAPYAARGAANVLEHRGGRAGAVGKAARVLADKMHHHENKMELAGLAMVAPGVTHPAARVVDKATTKKAALHKLAQAFYPDFEDLTEPEKELVLAEFVKMSAGPAMSIKGLRQAGKGSLEHLRSLRGQTPLNKELGAAATGFKMQRPGAPTPKGSIPKGPLTPPTPTTGASVAGTGPTFGGTLARAAGVGAVGLGLYGGAQAINTAASLAQGQRHYRPAAQPDFTTGSA